MITDWPLVPLGDVAHLEREMLQPASIRAGTPYVGLEHIDSDGVISNLAPIAKGQLGSTKYSFGPEHVLYGKLRPYLRKTARPDFAGICSTEIVPLRPGPRLDRGYLYHYLRLPATVQLAVARCAGANLPRISPREVLCFEILLPPLLEQQRIANILDKANVIRRKKKEALALTDEFLRSTFLEMFAEYLEVRHSRPLNEACEVLVDCRNKTAPYSATGVPLIRTTNFRRGKLDLRELRYVTEETNRIWSARYQPVPGDIVYCREAPFGMAAMIPPEFRPCLGQRIMVAKPRAEVAEGQYLLHALNSNFVFRQAEKVAVGATVKHLRVSDVEGLMVPVPPRTLQARFSELALKVNAVNRAGAQALEDSESLFEAVAQKAFRGELNSTERGSVIAD